MILVIGNCQHAGWACTLRLLFPGQPVKAISPEPFLAGDVDSALLDEVRAADLVFSLPWEERYGAIAESKIGNLTSHVILIPSFDFNGLHPDLTYLIRKDGSLCRGRLADYHSSICIAGYAAGFSAARTARLFNSLTYDQLGYFDVFDAARTWIENRFAAYGFDIREAFDRWAARGPFMMTVNHPRNWVLADVITIVCRARGTGIVHDIDYGSLFPDHLADAPQFPIYPEIARRHGMVGTYLFKPSAARLIEGLLDLETFVAQSFAAYEAEDIAQWHLSERTGQAVAWVNQLA